MTDFGEAQPKNPRALIKREPSPLKSAKELIRINPDIISIPAADGREGVQILPTPVYFTMDHGMTQWDFEMDAGLVNPQRDPRRYHAAYLFTIPSGEERFVTLPVTLFPESQASVYNQALLGEMAAQGFSSEVVTEECNYRRTKGGIDYLDARLLPAWRFITSGRKFLTTTPNPEEPQDILKSGWGNPSYTSTRDLTIIGDPTRPRDRTEFKEQGMYNYFQESEIERLPSGVNIISAPYSEAKAEVFEKELHERVLAANNK